MGEQERQRRVAQQIVGGAAEPETSEDVAGVGRHHDQVGAGDLRLVADHACDGAVLHGRGDADAGTGGLDAREGVGKIRRFAHPHLLVEVRIEDLHLGVGGIEALMRVDQMDAAISLASERERQRQGVLAEARAVQRNQERERHGDLRVCSLSPLWGRGPG